MNVIITSNSNLTDHINKFHSITIILYLSLIIIDGINNFKTKTSREFYGLIIPIEMVVVFDTGFDMGSSETILCSNLHIALA